MDPFVGEMSFYENPKRLLKVLSGGVGCVEAHTIILATMITSWKHQSSTERHMMHCQFQNPNTIDNNITLVALFTYFNAQLK